MSQPSGLDEASRARDDAAHDRVRLIVREFRGLREVDWTILPGVSLLVGPNGSGKTSVLSALRFLHDAYEGGVARAIRGSGAAPALRRLGAEPDAAVVLGLEVGAIRWELKVAVDGPTIHPHPGESLTLGDRVLLKRALYSDALVLEPSDRGPSYGAGEEAGLWLAHKLNHFEGIEAVEHLVALLGTQRSYFGFWPDRLREPEREGDQDGHLYPSGRNLFGVLRNWMSAPRKFGGQFEWVVAEIRRAFPGQIEGIEFDAVGRLVDARFFTGGVAGAEGSLPLYVAADGVLVGLALLAAVAGAPAHSLVVIDELENHLHPHAIRSILAAMRSRAEERDLRIVVTTHSPVAMNEFRDEPELVYVLEPGLDVVPKPLTKLHDPDWLAHFALGDLYAREKFAAPRPTG